MLPTDVMNMFTWVSLGAAIQNITTAASAQGLCPEVYYINAEEPDEPIAVISFHAGNPEQSLAQYIHKRCTNRSPYINKPLDSALIAGLSQSVKEFNAGIYWTTSHSDFDKMARMDAKSSFIRLEHKPLHDELFEILRFTRKDIENTKYGLTFESLEVPQFAVFFARFLQYWSVNRFVSKLGFGRMVAKQLSDKLRHSGAICLITAKEKTIEGYVQAGRAMEKLWLAVTEKGLSVQPYGVLPQYFTKVNVEPETFLPEYIKLLTGHNKLFYSIFPEAEKEFPAIVLRIGRAKKQSARCSIRMIPGQIIRNA
jgi:hypothetical protein